MNAIKKFFGGLWQRAKYLLAGLLAGGALTAAEYEGVIDAVPNVGKPGSIEDLIEDRVLNSTNLNGDAEVNEATVLAQMKAEVDVIAPEVAADHHGNDPVELAQA